MHKKQQIGKITSKLTGMKAEFKDVMQPCVKIVVRNNNYKDKVANGIIQEAML